MVLESNFVRVKIWNEGKLMNKLYDYFINKVFTVPYIDKMISGKNG